MSHRRRARARLYAATLALFAAAPPLLADDYYFVGPPNALWSDPNNWSFTPNGPGGAGVPGVGSAQDARAIVQPTIATSLTIDSDTVGMDYAAWFNAPSLGASLTVTPAGGTFYASNVSVGPNTTVLQSTSKVWAHTTIGIAAGGRYVVSGDSANVYSQSDIDVAAGGTFEQSAGIVSTSSYATLNGSYSLSGGRFGTEMFYVNGTPDAPATFTQTGGSAQTLYDLLLGPSATYSLSAGNFTGYRKIIIGNSTADKSPGAGSYFNQSGGSVTVTSETDSVHLSALIVSSDPANPAAYHLSGNGAVRFSQPQFDPQYTPPLLIANDPNSVGTFVQSGGTVGGDGSPATAADRPYQVTLGVAAGATGTYNLSAGTLAAANLTVGSAGTGSFTQTGGTVTLCPLGTSAPTSALILGGAAGSTGTYSLSGTGTLVASNIAVGGAGVGVGSFVQTGGTVTATSSVILSNTGSLSLAGTGTLATQQLINNGTLAQAGGTLSLESNGGGNLALGTTAGSSATYALSGGTVSFSQTPSTFTVADSGTASVTQTGGTIGASGSRGGNVTTPTYLYLAKSAGSAANYSLSGTGSLYAGFEYVGNTGTATFSQSGGNHYAQSTLYIGYNAGATGTYNLSGGQLNADDLHVAESGTATFNLSGGTADTSAFSAAVNTGSSATLNLTGGTLTVSPPNPVGNVRLGYHGTATINHTGGTFDTSRNLVVTTLGAGSTYSLSGTGSLKAYHLFVGDQGAAASFTQSGGTNTVTSTLALANAPGSSATYSLIGGSVSADSLSVGSSGGALFAQYGGSTSFPSGIKVGGGPDTARYTVGRIAADSPTGSSFPIVSTGPIVLDGPAPSLFIQNSGGVSAASILVGRNASYSYASGSTLTLSGAILVGGTPAGAPASYPSDAGATFTQNGGFALQPGLNVADGADAITVNANPGSSATFNLAGGNLYFPGNHNLTVGSTTTGTFNQTGGWISPPTVVSGHSFPNNPNTITLGKAAGATGTYLLSGNGASVGATNLVVGDAGAGSFSQSGGGAGATNLTLAKAAGSTGSYALSAGSLNASSATVAAAGSAYFRQTGGSHTVGTLTIAAEPGSSGVYDLVGGSLSANAVTNNGTFYMESPASFASHSFTNNGSTTLDGAQSWSPGSTFSNTLVAYFHSDPGSPAAANLSVTSASPDWAPVVFDAPATHLASLALSSTTHATLPTSTGIPRLLSTRALSITDSAQLDLANNILLLDYDSPSPAGKIRQYLHDARLTSSSADATHRLGYFDDGTSITVHLTLAGDTNLDGRLDPDDYTLIDRAFAQSLTDAHWTDGDFNYDGQITSVDYLLIDTTLGLAQGFSPGFLAMRESQFGADYVSELLVSVPEPSSVACLFAGFFFTRRRRCVYRREK